NVLHRAFKIRHKLRSVKTALGKQAQNALGLFIGVKIEQAQPVQRIDRIQAFDQIDKGFGLTTEGVSVLTDQADLAHARRSQIGAFGKDLVDLAAAKGAAELRN